MKINMNSDKPIFLQISEELEDAIFIGAFAEETQIPSTTEISTLFKINPATVLKGMNILVNDGLIYKKRGVGMFVADGALEKIKQKRHNSFYENYIYNLVNEAKKLNLTKKDVLEMLERGFENE